MDNNIAELVYENIEQINPYEISCKIYIRLNNPLKCIKFIYKYKENIEKNKTNNICQIK